MKKTIIEILDIWIEDKLVLGGSKKKVLKFSAPK